MRLPLQEQRIFLLYMCTFNFHIINAVTLKKNTSILEDGML